MAAPESLGAFLEERAREHQRHKLQQSIFKSSTSLFNIKKDVDNEVGDEVGDEVDNEVKKGVKSGVKKDVEKGVEKEMIKEMIKMKENNEKRTIDERIEGRVRQLRN